MYLLFWIIFTLVLLISSVQVEECKKNKIKKIRADLGYDKIECKWSLPSSYPPTSLNDIHAELSSINDTLIDI